MTSDLAPAIIMEVASMRKKRADKRTKQRGASDSRSVPKLLRQHRRIAKNKARRPPMHTVAGAHNTIHPDSEMQLFLCDSVRDTLRRLEDEEYERKHGK